VKRWKSENQNLHGSSSKFDLGLGKGETGIYSACKNVRVKCAQYNSGAVNLLRESERRERDSHRLCARNRSIVPVVVRASRSRAEGERREPEKELESLERSRE